MLSTADVGEVQERTAAGRIRVSLLEPNAALRSAVVDVLTAENYDVDACACLEDVLDRRAEVALVSWQGMQGLLAEERRQDLIDLGRQMALVLMVPRSWARVLSSTDLGVAGLLPKPFDADSLVSSLRRARVGSAS